MVRTIFVGCMVVAALLLSGPMVSSVSARLLLHRVEMDVTPALLRLEWRNVAPTRDMGSVASFGWTDGTSTEFFSDWKQGVVQLTGGLRLGRSGHRVVLQDMRIDIARRRITGDLAGDRTRVATWPYQAGSDNGIALHPVLTGRARRLIRSRVRLRHSVSRKLLGTIVLYLDSDLPK